MDASPEDAAAVVAPPDHVPDSIGRPVRIYEIGYSDEWIAAHSAAVALAFYAKMIGEEEMDGDEEAHAMSGEQMDRYSYRIEETHEVKRILGPDVDLLSGVVTVPFRVALRGFLSDPDQAVPFYFASGNC